MFARFNLDVDLDVALVRERSLGRIQPGVDCRGASGEGRILANVLTSDSTALCTLYNGENHDGSQYSAGEHVRNTILTRLGPASLSSLGGTRRRGTRTMMKERRHGIMVEVKEAVKGQIVSLEKSLSSLSIFSD